MRFCIKHEMKGRLRIHIIQNRMTYAEADTLSWYLEEQENVTEVKVYERTADAVICYKGEREEILTVLKQFSYEKAEVPETVLSSSGRQLNEEYKERLITKTVLHYGSKLFLPMPGTGSDHFCEISEIHLERDSLSGTWQAGSSGTGCNSDQCIGVQKRFCNRRFCYVPAGNR